MHHVIYLCLCVKLTFTDINECTEDTHSCDGNASCTNTNGSYNCTCNFGFEGDGLNCTGMYGKIKLVLNLHIQNLAFIVLTVNSKQAVGEFGKTTAAIYKLTDS